MKKTEHQKFKKSTGQDKFKAYENVFDEQTLRTLFKLSSQGYFDYLKSPISIGKESNVFSATKDDGLVAVKVYRVSANFKKMYDYMAADPRFMGLKRQKTNVIYNWAKKEYRNLLRSREAGVAVPTPLAVNKNVLVLEFIGKKEAAKQIHFQPPEDPESFYETLINDIRKLYQKARLVHADLSSYNILDNEGKPVIIDLSHAVDLRYPGVNKLLERDLQIICTFFNKLGLELDHKDELRKVQARTEDSP
jgi:RIO kinase 1